MLPLRPLLPELRLMRLLPQAETNPKAFPLADAALTNQILDLVQQVRSALPRMCADEEHD